MTEHLHYTFDKKHRINDPLDFRLIFDEGASTTRGPLKLFVRPNDRKHPRLGISVPKRVGTAPRRNRIKRMIREAFRLMKYDWPGDGGYDLVVAVRPHAPMMLAEYQRILSAAMMKLARPKSHGRNESSR